MAVLERMRGWLAAQADGHLQAVKAAVASFIDTSSSARQRPAEPCQKRLLAGQKL
jgi:hypothetical protein